MISPWMFLDSAIAFAATAHAGQLRKGGLTPYIVHPLEVMQLVQQHATGEVTEDMLIAAVLHDVVEDTPVGLETIERRFGKGVAGLVDELTDKFIDPALGNRAARKQMERERLAVISVEAQSIKYADLISNTSSIVAVEPGFAHTYLREKELSLEAMTRGDPGLRLAAYSALAEGQAELVQLALEKKP